MHLWVVGVSDFLNNSVESGFAVSVILDDAFSAIGFVQSVLALDDISVAVLPLWFMVSGMFVLNSVFEFVWRVVKVVMRVVMSVGGFSTSVLMSFNGLRCWVVVAVMMLHWVVLVMNFNFVSRRGDSVGGAGRNQCESNESLGNKMISSDDSLGRSQKLTLKEFILVVLDWFCCLNWSEDLVRAPFYIAIDVCVNIDCWVYFGKRTQKFGNSQNSMTISLPKQLRDCVPFDSLQQSSRFAFFSLRIFFFFVTEGNTLSALWINNNFHTFLWSFFHRVLCFYAHTSTGAKSDATDQPWKKCNFTVGWREVFFSNFGWLRLKPTDSLTVTINWVFLILRIDWLHKRSLVWPSGKTLVKFWNLEFFMIN